MNAYDYYGEAKSLAEDLNKAGFSMYSSEILGAMEEGGTGTEIFMILRARLARLISEEKFPLDLMERVKALHKKLSNALN